VILSRSFTAFNSVIRIQLKNELEKVKGRGKHKSRIAAAASKTQTKMRNSLNMVSHCSFLAISHFISFLDFFQLASTYSGASSPGYSIRARLHTYNEDDDNDDNEDAGVVCLLEPGDRLTSYSLTPMKGKGWLFVEERK
jgi:hypothetical protein